MTENELIKRLKNNENDAYKTLVLSYSKRLYYYCFKLLKNSFDAQDATQITFIKIHQSIGSFEKRCCLSSWIYKIATNVCNDILRKKRKTMYIPLSRENTDNDSYDISLIDHNSDTEKIVLKKERHYELFKGIEKLSPIQKDLITLRDINGLSYDDISKRLSLKSGTVKSGLNRARKKLRIILEENNFE